MKYNPKILVPKQSIIIINKFQKNQLKVIDKIIKIKMIIKFIYNQFRFKEVIKKNKQEN